MTTPDLIVMLGNLSRSLYPIQHLITGFAYLLGILFFIFGLGRLRKMADRTTQSPSQEKVYGFMIYFLMGAVLLYLPSALKVAANTAFGADNVLTYAPVVTTDIYTTVGLLVRTAGILWFVRGCVLIAHTSDPGSKTGPKGMAFLVAGILAMNFDNTVAMFNSILGGLMKMSLVVKNKTGF